MCDQPGTVIAFPKVLSVKAIVGMCNRLAWAQYARKIEMFCSDFSGV